MAATREARAVYGDTTVVAVELHLSILSPLAEGADRIVAQEGLAQGYTLACVLPFLRTEYENDFRSLESKREFDDLLNSSGPDVVELDGVRGEAQDKSYDAAGRHVVRNCDILIAIWNGRPSRGLGGTADIVNFAIGHGPPVWWIHADASVAPSWVIDEKDLQSPTHADGLLALHTYLAMLVLPPVAKEAHASTWFERAARLFRKPETPPFLSYQITPAMPDRWIWRAHEWLIRIMAGHPGALTLPRSPSSTVAGYWFDQFAPADALAKGYARRYRSAYVWVFGLGALAVMFGSIALVAPAAASMKFTITGIEFISLILITCVVLLNERRNWHRLFLQHRLLAELCRKQQALAAFGWSLPGPSVTRKSLTLLPGESAQPHIEGEWVGWLFGVLQRAAPKLRGEFSTHRTAQARDEAVRDLIEDQLNYHRGRAAESQRASDRLGRLGELFFIAVLLFVAIKLALVAIHADHALILLFGLAAAVLPALSAGFIGIRSYAELSLLADQSRQMDFEMASAQRRVRLINVAEPLASQQVGAEIYDVATVMLRDIHGWVQLFRAKVVEPG